MKKYEVILFDLDGTLVDPCMGITNSLIYSLKKFDIEITDRSELFKFIGPPLYEAFENYYNFTREQTIKAVGFFREYYSDKGIYENTMYDGIEPLLKTLQESEKTIILATSKPEYFATRILEHFNIRKYFKYVAGANLDETRTKKDEVIRYALTANKITDRSSALMIGDREHDIIGANQTGINSIGVLYGYGSREELVAAKATYIAENIKDIEKIICPQIICSQ